mgnify:CR=1 FL=1
MSKRVLRPILLILVPCLAVAGALLVWLWGGRYVATENAYVKADIARVSAEVTGRVAEVLVTDHQLVKKNDILVRLDADPYKIALAKADAEVDVTRHNVRTMIAQWREAQSELKDAQGQVAYWEAQLDRNKTLAARRIVSNTRLEEVENNHRRARDQVVLMQRKVARMLSQLGGTTETPVDDHPLVRQKIAARDEAALNLKRTVIRALVDGVAVNVKLQPGEYVEPEKPLFALVVSNRPWVEANFKETELTHVRKGMTATVVLDIYPDIEWQADVISISPATGAEFALLPPQNASGNWVKVVQRLPVRLALKPVAGEPPLRAGMTATVSIDTKRERKLSHLLGIFNAFASNRGKDGRTAAAH